MSNEDGCDSSNDSGNDNGSTTAGDNSTIGGDPSAMAGDPSTPATGGLSTEGNPPTIPGTGYGMVNRDNVVSTGGDAPVSPGPLDMSIFGLGQQPDNPVFGFAQTQLGQTVNNLGLIHAAPAGSDLGNSFMAQARQQGFDNYATANNASPSFVQGSSADTGYAQPAAGPTEYDLRPPSLENYDQVMQYAPDFLGQQIPEQYGPLSFTRYKMTGWGGLLPATAVGVSVGTGLPSLTAGLSAEAIGGISGGALTAAPLAAYLGATTYGLPHNATYTTDGGTKI